MGKIYKLVKKNGLWQNENLHEKAEINLKRRTKGILNNYNYSSMPNIISKSNYFLPVQDVDEYYIPIKRSNFSPLIILSHLGESKTSLSYVGQRGNMWDFILFAKLLNEADSNDLSLTLTEKELFNFLKVDSKNKWTVKRIKDALFKFRTTVFQIEFPYQNKQYASFFHLAKELSMPFDDEESDDVDIYHITFTDMLKKTAALDYFNNVDLKLLESEQLKRKYHAAKLYTFLCAHEKECQISLDNMIALINPHTKNIKSFIQDFKNRAIEPLSQIGFLDRDKVIYDRKNRCFLFKEGSFTTSSKRHVQVRRELMELKLKRRRKSVKLRNQKHIAGTKSNTAGDKILPRLKHRKDVLDIFEYWESLNLYTHKNKESNIYLLGMKNLSKAIAGTLYVNTKYDEYNNKFEPKYIKKAIKVFHTKTTDLNYYPLDKKYLQKLPLAYFMLPNNYTQVKIEMPEFIQCYKGNISLVVKPLDDVEIKFFFGSFARYNNKNICDLTSYEKINIIKAFNTLYEEGFIKQHLKVVNSDPNILYRTVIVGLSQIFDKKIQAEDLTNIKVKNKYSSLLNGYIKKNGYSYN